MPIGSRDSGAATGPNIPPRSPADLTGLVVPRQPADLRIVRYDEVFLSGLTPFGVTLDLVMRIPDGPSFFVLIDRIVVSVFGGGAAVATFYRGDATTGAAQPKNQVEQSTSAAWDVAALIPPIVFPATEAFTARFENVGTGPGAYECTVRYQLRIAQQVVTLTT